MTQLIMTQHLDTTTTAGSTSPIKKLVSNVKNAYEVMKAGVGKVTTKVAAKASAGVEKARKGIKFRIENPQTAELDANYLF